MQQLTLNVTDTKLNVLLDFLIEKNLLWSYNPEQAKYLPESIIIEHILLYGDVPQLRLLFRTIALERIEKVWEQHLLPQPNLRKTNYYLAKFYFNKQKNIFKYIDHFINHETRRDKLQRLIAENG